MINNNKLCTFYVVRHGETEWNVKGLLQGQINIPLNKKGEVQAKDLAGKFAHINFHEVYSSDLLRCKRTAELIVLEKQITIQTTKALRERYFGKFEGAPWKENKEFEEYITMMRNLSKEQIKQGKWEIEDDESAISRFLTFLREIATYKQEKNIFIVTHGGVMRVILIHLGYGTSQTLPPSSIANTAYVKIESDGIDFFIKETYGITLKK